MGINASTEPQGILILDFGSQYSQLIARRIRELGVFAEIQPYDLPLSEVIRRRPAGIILSGGPSSVYGEDAHLVSPRIYELGIPVLGICYGMQLTAHLLGGKVEPGEKGEYGRSRFYREGDSPLWDGVPRESVVWMSHFDEVVQVPPGFEPLGRTDTCLAAFGDPRKKIYALQFHPEVAHTQYGTQILENFVLKICRAPRNWNLDDFALQSIEEIRRRTAGRRVVLGLSGGVDSSVAAVLIHRAIGERLTAVFVDTGLLRKDEKQLVREQYEKHFRMNIRYADAQDKFLDALAGITDPEAKRKIIGRLFVDVFRQQAGKIPDVAFLAQGTIYPDVIESRSAKGGPSATIKSHHNVGGLPEDLDLEILEPLRELFKDEVRRLGIKLGIPRELLMRHPFPGPGLAVRIPGEITRQKVAILQQADAIFLDELRRAGWYSRVAQAFAVLLPVKSVGVMGDRRTYAYTLVLRAVDTQDFMTASWSRLPYELLDRTAARIINEVSGINRVLYDISTKPPATIEWE